MPQLQPGMTIAARQQMRDQILENHLAQARYRASLEFHTDTCRRARTLEDFGSTYEKSVTQELHQKCRGEEAGRGGGCLCTCHDEYPAAQTVSGVVIRAAVEPPMLIGDKEA
jgi:hypothetical protein